LPFATRIYICILRFIGLAARRWRQSGCRRGVGEWRAIARDGEDERTVEGFCSHFISLHLFENLCL